MLRCLFSIYIVWLEGNKMDTIYDCILKKVVPIYKATNEGIRQFLSRTCDDDPINHNLILGCIIELEKREKNTWQIKQNML